MYSYVIKSVCLSWNENPCCQKRECNGKQLFIRQENWYDYDDCVPVNVSVLRASASVITWQTSLLCNPYSPLPHLYRSTMHDCCCDREKSRCNKIRIKIYDMNQTNKNWKHGCDVKIKKNKKKTGKNTTYIELPN